MQYRVIANFKFNHNIKMIMKKVLLGLSLLMATFFINGCASKSAVDEVTPKEVQHHAIDESARHETHWDYAENGPTHWGEFAKECSDGKAQSPINIISGKTYKLNPDDVIYLDEDVQTTAKVIDNGHSIKVTPEKAVKMTFKDNNYQLLQFHFHGKSEHTVDGKRYDMVVHFVHQNIETKQLLVVAVFFEEGEENLVLNSVIDHVGETIVINPRDLIPEDVTHYYHYIGSLTTPPCSENVQWYLLKNPNNASKKQIAKFRTFYVDNERPIQELNDRHVESY